MDSVPAGSWRMPVSSHVLIQELERRAVLAGYSHIYLTTGFRQPEAVNALSQPGV